MRTNDYVIIYKSEYAKYDCVCVTANNKEEARVFALWNYDCFSEEDVVKVVKIGMV